MTSTGFKRLTANRISTLTGALGLALIVIVVALAAAHERGMLLREAKEHARNSTFFLADHAQRLFEVSDIALRSTTTAIDALDWTAIERSRPLWDNLKEVSQLLPFIDQIWLNDASGRLRLSTHSFPPPDLNANDRAIFDRVRTSSGTLVIGEPIVGRLSHKPTFLVARRLANPDGSFRGMIAVTLDLDYFNTYWRRLDLPNGEHVAVVNAVTGDVLASYGRERSVEAQADDFTAPAAFVAGMPETGSYQPATRAYGFFHRVGDLPVYTTVEFSKNSVSRIWRDWLLHLSPLAAAAFVSLLGIMTLGRRQARREAAAARDLAAARGALEIANGTLERRVAERTADLQDSNDEIQRFAYIVSHDLRAPLVNIMGFTSELEGLRPTLFAPGTAGAATPEPRHDFDEALGFIRSSIDKMDRLIKAILTLSRDGRRTFRREPIDMAVLLRSVADGVAHRALTIGATLTIAPLPPLATDRIAIEQIFANLVDNAVKYLRPDVPGRIEVSGRRVGDRVRIAVVDNGRGIADKDRERVFELFRRAGPQDQPGEGIGLAHVRALVRRLGGQITLDGAPGGGTVFTVELPDLLESEGLGSDR